MKDKKDPYATVSAYRKAVEENADDLQVRHLGMLLKRGVKPYKVMRCYMEGADAKTRRTHIFVRASRSGILIDLTKDLPEAPIAKRGQAYVDTKRLPNAEEFIRRYDLGSPVAGAAYRCEGHTYPLYSFARLPNKTKERSPTETETEPLLVAEPKDRQTDTEKTPLSYPNTIPPKERKTLPDKARPKRERSR